MSKIEAVIFDWAGTTVDFGSFAPVGAFIATFRTRNIEPTLEEVRAPMGMLKKEHIRTMLEMPRIAECFNEFYGRSYNEADLDEMYEYYEEALLGVLNDYADPKPFVLDTMEELKNRNIRIGSTTGYNDKMMSIVVKKARENGYEPDYWCSPDAVESKSRPRPFMVFKNMEVLDISSVNAVIKVGDTVSDIKEGKNAGVISVGVIEGSSEMALSEEEWDNLSKEGQDNERNRVRKIYIDAGADYTINNMSELCNLIDKIEK